MSSSELIEIRQLTFEEDQSKAERESWKGNSQDERVRKRILFNHHSRYQHLKIVEFPNSIVVVVVIVTQLNSLT